MCVLCGFTSCSDGCPNKEDDIALGQCANCGELLYDGYECLINDDKDMFCEEKCVLEYYGIKEYWRY